MKEMVYGNELLNPPEVLAAGTYKGTDYYILNLGTHPCAYVDVTSTPLDGVSYENIDIECHGGLTYSREYLATVDKEGWFIGWDYGHYDDYMGCFCSPIDEICTKKWTTEEILREVKEVIDQLDKYFIYKTNKGETQQ